MISHLIFKILMISSLFISYLSTCRLHTYASWPPAAPRASLILRFTRPALHSARAPSSRASLAPQPLMDHAQVIGIINQSQTQVGARQLVQVLAQLLVPQ
jgi:hypothetical protein